MPVMDGFEATRRIRAGEAGVRDSQVPVIAMTADAMEGDRERVLAAGMDDYLTKPIDTARIAAAISRWVGGRKHTAASADAESEGDADLPFSARQLLDHMAGDLELAVSLLPEIVGGIEAESEVLQAAIARCDGDAARRAAHTAKGLAAGACSQPLVELARRIEALLGEGRFDEAEQQWPEWERELERLCSATQAWLAEQKGMTG